MGDDRFEAEEGEDSLLTNAELIVGVVSSILQDSDLKKVEALCVEEALALSLHGTVSVCLTALFYSSCCCVNVYLLTPSCSLADDYLYKGPGEEGQFVRELY